MRVHLAAKLENELGILSANNVWREKARRGSRVYPNFSRRRAPAYVIAESPYFQTLRVFKYQFSISKNLFAGSAIFFASIPFILLLIR